MTLLDRPPTTIDDRVERLNSASVKRVIEPEERFDWSSLGAGQLLPDELLSVADLDLDLTPEQRVRLSREETAAMMGIGVAFEAILTAGFAMQIAHADKVGDPRVTYMLHEIGEESRHSRAFVRLIEAIGPTAVNPMNGTIPRLVMRRVTSVLTRSPALLGVMILAGEELPDLVQKLASEHPDTDPLVAAVSRYHRQEEARHLAFARMTLPELYAEASAMEKLRIRYFAPVIIRTLFDGFVHPGVYATVGLPAMATWRAANRSPGRVALRHQATRPVLRAVVDAGIFRPGSIPRGWRSLCGVDPAGEPID